MHARGMMIHSPLNVTPEELGNMTLKEIKEREIDALNCSLEEGMPFCGKAGRGAQMAFAPSSSCRHCWSGTLERGFSPLLLMDEISLEELGEMSLNQILDLYDQKVDELDRMTINELREQWKKSMEAQSNMTLNELVEEARDRQAKEGIFNWVSLQYRRLVA